MPGPNGEKRRTGDRGRWARFYWGAWSSYLRDAVMAVALFLMVITLGLVYIEGKKREDQFCTQAEGEHKRNVDQYRDTLSYLDGLRRTDPQEIGRGINPFIISRLGDTEARARKDNAPPLCDKKSVKTLNPFARPTEIGRKEPDPVLPERTAEDVQRQLAPYLKRR